MVQLYTSINEYLKWEYNEIKAWFWIESIYPIVLYIEDHYLSFLKYWPSGNWTIEYINNKVYQKLIELWIDPSIIKSNPYNICSSDEFWYIIQTIDIIWIKDFFQQYLTPKYHWRQLIEYIKKEYPKLRKDMKKQFFSNISEEIMRETKNKLAKSRK